MEVHFKKMHSEKITCGLCDFETKDDESLETHLFTCEIYKCIFKDLKTHINKEHNGKPTTVTHAKMDRNKADNFDDNFLISNELFRKHK